MTAHEFALAMGWDFSAIEATAKNGVSAYDIEALESTDLTEAEVLAWCKEQVNESQGE